MSEIKPSFTYDELVAAIQDSVALLEIKKLNNYPDQLARKQTNEYLERLGMAPQFTVIDEPEGEN